MAVTEERFSRLEQVVADFVVAVEEFRRRNEASMESLKTTMEEFKRQAEADRGQAEADRRYWNKRWGEQANQLGLFAESIVAPSLPRIAQQEFGMGPLTFKGERVRRWHRAQAGRSREFDLVLADAKILLVSETRSKPDADDVNEFAAVLTEIFEYFPEYAGAELIPVFASLHIKEELVVRLTRLNIYALEMSEDTMQLLNKEAVARV